MQVINTEKIPIKSWTNVIEDSALVQILNLANLPFAFRHVAIMPDVHAGYGMPIGGVLATKGVVIPNAVGVDIGCGMYAQKTGLLERDMTSEMIKKLFGGSKDYHGGIRASVPVGFSHHSKKQDDGWMPDLGKIGLVISPSRQQSIIFEQYESALKQVGTLGGGNHFIEIQADQDGVVWFMIHSGSRNLGYKVANHYNALAKELNARWHAGVSKAWDLAFLPLSSDEAEAYLAEMNYCVQFAEHSRALMAERIRRALEDAFDYDISWHGPYNVAHNYARMEHHFGENVMVHRKGATSARAEEYGIIPGSQGTASYIVKGLGNVESFQSCSHGAGRCMSRTKARDELNLEVEIKRLNDAGVIHGLRNKKDLDEAASAYKNIDMVMDEQSDLVETMTRLKPLAVIKG